MSGEATYEGAAGGCNMDEGLDWDGTETIEILESKDPSVAEGCVYKMEVEGVYVGGA